MLADEQLRELRNAYNVHKKTTKYWGRKDKAGNLIEFRLTFDEWCAVWIASGQAFNRGTAYGKYCMSRIGDLGHYELGNVFIQLTSENARQGMTGVRHSQETREQMSCARKGKKSATV